MKTVGTILLSMLLLLGARSNSVAAQNPDPLRFQGEIEAFRQWDAKNAVPKSLVLFVGSSSIRMWRTAEAFPDLPVVNRGFGGAHISDLLFFIHDILLRYPTPSAVVFYCGDNDIAGGKDAESVARDFRAFVDALRRAFPQTPLVYLPIKPSIARWNLWPTMAQANELVREMYSRDELLFYADTATPMIETGEPPAADLFLEDGLHLSEKGYALWRQVLAPMLKQALKR